MVTLGPMGLVLHQVDAFATEPFSGNPAAVCVLDAPRDEAWMQAVAAEMNLSETAYLLPDGDAWSLRWFTPQVEVDLCGHATLASAHVLFEQGHAAPLRFRTKSGDLQADREGDRIVLDFPALFGEPAESPDGLAEALGAEPVAISRSRFDILAELDSEETVRNLCPDIGRLAGLDVRGVTVTARAAEYDFVSRYCALTPYWAEKLGRLEMTAFQASRRGGVVYVKLEGDRVKLAGNAVTVLRAELLVE